MRFVHSADWQIGKVFKQFGAKEEMLRQARLAAAGKRRRSCPTKPLGSSDSEGLGT